MGAVSDIGDDIGSKFSTCCSLSSSIANGLLAFSQLPPSRSLLEVRVGQEVGDCPATYFLSNLPWERGLGGEGSDHRYRASHHNQPIGRREVGGEGEGVEGRGGRKSGVGRGDLGRIEGAGVVDSAEDEVIEEGEEEPGDGWNILIPHGAKEEGPGTIGAKFEKEVTQHLSAGGIVSPIEEEGVASGTDAQVEPSGPGGMGESFGDGGEGDRPATGAQGLND